VTLAQFVAACKLDTLAEVPKVCHLAFYHLKKDGAEEFSAGDCAKWLDDLHLPKPNTSRLAVNLTKCRDTVRGSNTGLFRLHHTYRKKMEELYPQFAEKSQEVVDHGTILPPVLYEKTRGFVESLARQINRSYEENIFDGCAVLMRRLEEVLLIMAYQHLQIDAEIKDGSGNYVLLEGIVSNAQSNTTLNLGRNSKKTIEKIREMGNYSAHQIHYQCRREWIQEKIEEYRALVTELLSKAGLR
jgi:hypothetical protein